MRVPSSCIVLSLRSLAVPPHLLNVHPYVADIAVRMEGHLSDTCKNDSVQLGLSQHLCLLMLTQHNLLTNVAALLPADCHYINCLNCISQHTRTHARTHTHVRLCVRVQQGVK